MPSWAGLHHLLTIIATGDIQPRRPNASAPRFIPSATAKTPSRGRLLVATHRLYQWAGSELVALELAEECRRRGWDIALYVPFVDRDFVAQALGPSTAVYTQPQHVDLRVYDAVYSQHQTLSALVAAQPPTFPFEGPVPVVIYNHLSPHEPLEFPGPFVEAQLADLILSNSPETAARLTAFGPRFAAVEVFANPAPAAFIGNPEAALRASLRRLLAVSNHLPAELAQAFGLLATMGIAVTRLGLPHHARRLTPTDLADHDAIVTIGKSVQYALCRRRPVFCYDQFGGPGWLNEDNFAAAAAANFSGRSDSRRRGAEDLAQELVRGFAAAWSFSQQLSEELLAPYRLETRLTALLEQIESLRGRRHPLQASSPAAQVALRRQWDHEAVLYHLVDRYFLAHHPQAALFNRADEVLAKSRP